MHVAPFHKPRGICHLSGARAALSLLTATTSHPKRPGRLCILPCPPSWGGSEHWEVARLPEQQPISRLSPGCPQRQGLTKGALPGVPGEGLAAQGPCKSWHGWSCPSARARAAGPSPKGPTPPAPRAGIPGAGLGLCQACDAPSLRGTLRQSKLQHN